MEALNRFMLEDNQSRLFLLMANEDIDIVDGINKFMKSDLAKEIDRDFSSMQLFSSNIWLDELYNEVSINKGIKDEHDPEIIFWLGYFYRKWHYLTGEPSFKIVRYLPPLEGIKGYMLYHQIEENNAINIIKSRYNEKRNVHRKYDYKNIKNVINSDDMKDKTFLSYLSRRMLYKLFNDERIKAFRFIKEKECFVLKERNASISTLIVQDEDLLKAINNHVAPNYEENNLFVFLFNDKYKSDDDLMNTIKEIRNSEVGHKYMSLYFYIPGALYEVDASNAIHRYNMMFTNRDKSLVKKEIVLNKAYEEIEDKLVINY